MILKRIILGSALLAVGILLCNVAVSQQSSLRLLTINVWSGLDYVGELRMSEYESAQQAEGRSFFFGMVEKIFGLICHQDPSRLIIIDGKQLPLCPRCSGLHLGFLISFVVSSIVVRGRIVFKGKSNRFFLMAAVALTGVDWSLGQLGLAEPGAMSRLMTGLITGAALGIILQGYRRDLIPQLTTQSYTFGIARTVGVLGVSSFLGFIVSNVDSWIALTTIIFFSVLINAIVIIQTSAVLLLQRRLCGAKLQSTNI